MREIPDCLNRRYQALDELIKELSAAMPRGETTSDRSSCESNQLGIKLMCDFWNILKDDPECNLTQEIQQRMGIEERVSSGGVRGECVHCYVAGKDDDRKPFNSCVNRVQRINVPKENSTTPPRRYGCGNPDHTDKLPLSKVLCNLKEAASFDKKCNVRVAELVAAQQELTEQIQTLEEREKQGVLLLKQADCMWSCMEDSYKKKVAESQDKHKVLLKELKEVETSANKWRKNKKDLEFQLSNINKCHEEIIEKINQKKNDMKVMDMEIEDFKKRILSNVKDIEVAKNSLSSKRDASDARMANIAAEMRKLQTKVKAELQYKANKEQEGTQYVKEAREDLQKICRVLLQKKLENEDLQAEKDALLQEIDLLKKTCDNCKEKCTNKEKAIADEIKRVEGELASFRAKCIRCHECTDTIDVRKFCTDCPRCLAERDCLYEDDHCSPDHTMDCVCMSVKQKFLDNVFDNMYTVLERQSKTCPGKEVADCVLNCLRRSRNGKLNQETRKILQDFILSTVKKNLNLTIVGGAVKTRCEMDPETYKQLMLCLKEVNVTKPPKEDKGSVAKKEPCRRWGGTSECNCPKGPKACICTKKAPPPPTDPTSCGPPDTQQKDEGMKICPQREPLACSTDCGMLGLPGSLASKREPCQGQTCPFSNNMRAAQCVLGPEALANVQKTHPTPPIIPNLPAMDKMATCTCGGKAIKPCPCRRDRRSQPRQRIIEEVLGRFNEVSPIEKVPAMAARQYNELNSTRRIDTGCDCSNLPMKYLLASNTSRKKICRYCACASNYVSWESRTPFLSKLHNKGSINICRSSKSDSDVRGDRNMAVSSDIKFQTPPKNTIIRSKSDSAIKVTLCPKFPHSSDDKIGISLGTKKFESTQLRLNTKSSLKKDDRKLNSCDASFVGRKVCETVKELMKDIVVPEVPPTSELSPSEVEWVTLESLFKEISSLTKLEGPSNDTFNEVEVKCETLEASKEFRLLDKNMNEVKSIPFQTNVIDVQQNVILKEDNTLVARSESIHKNIITKEDSTRVSPSESIHKNDKNEIIKENNTNVAPSESIHKNKQNLVIKEDNTCVTPSECRVATSESIYKNEEHGNMIAEKLKSKLLADIRQSYNISVETSIDNVVVNEPDYNANKFKNVRKCLRNLGEGSTEYKCNCQNAQRQKCEDNKSNLLKTNKSYFRENSEDIDNKSSNYTGLHEIKKCLLAISNMHKEEFQKRDSKVKNQMKNKLDFIKRNKNKKSDKKNK